MRESGSEERRGESSSVKGAKGSGRWIAIEIERAQAISRSESVKQQKAEGGMAEVQQQYGVSGSEKVLKTERLIAELEVKEVNEEMVE